MGRSPNGPRLTAHGTGEKNECFFAVGHAPCTVYPFHTSPSGRLLKAFGCGPRPGIRKQQILKNHIFPAEKKTRRNSFAAGKNSPDPEIRRRKRGPFRKIAAREKEISKTSQKEKKSGDQEMWIHLYTFSERRRSL
jgi:hypothetical protein